MKPRPKPKPRPEILIAFLLLLIPLHFSCGLCIHSSHPKEEDLINMKQQHLHPESYLIGRKNSMGNHDEALRPDDGGVTDYDDDYQPDYHTSSSDVAVQVAETTSPGHDLTRVSPRMDESEVMKIIDKVRNRIRRQSPLNIPSDSTIQWRRKHKRRHRLLLKSRNHSSNNPQEGRKGRKPHRSLILKSDSEAHIITSASEVKKDWCRTVPFTHKVTAPRCIPKVISNNFCYGQCNSFFIPQQRTSKGVAFQSYSNCKPDRLRWSNITLDCPDLIPPIVQKTVLIVDSCRCIAMDEPNDERLNKNIRHFTRHFKGRSKKRT